MKHVIGFFGVAHSGKSTAAHYAAESLRTAGYSAQVRAFAGPLKKGLAQMGIEKDTDPILYRSAAQYLGTEVVRTYDPDWWVKQMKRAVSDAPEDGIVLIDDCRFENEFEYLREIGADVVFVHAGRRVNLDSYVYLHDSEAIAVEYEKFFSNTASGCTVPADLLESAKPDYVLLNQLTTSFMFDRLVDILYQIVRKI